MPARPTDIWSVLQSIPQVQSPKRARHTCRVMSRRISAWTGRPAAHRGSLICVQPYNSNIPKA